MIVERYCARVIASDVVFCEFVVRREKREKKEEERGLREERMHIKCAFQRPLLVEAAGLETRRYGALSSRKSEGLARQPLK